MSEDNVRCPFCESLDHSYQMTDTGYDRKPYDIVKCKSCGFRYLSPRPEDSYLADIYSNYYPDTMNDLKYRQPVFESLCDLIHKFKGPQKILLDLGCGTGDFLWLAQMRGWKVKGVEISGKAVDFARKMRNLDVVQGPLDALPLDDQSVDVVTILDVLEHLNNPSLVLKEIHRVLKPGGRAIVHVPNTPFQILKSKALRLRHGKRTTTMATPLHVNHFDATSLRQFASKNDLRVEKIFPGFADRGGPGLDVKKSYVTFSRILWSATGLQVGHSLCMIASK